MSKKKILAVFFVVCLFLSGCGLFADKKTENTPVNNNAKIAAEASDTPSISIVSIREEGGKLLDRSGEALKSGGQAVAEGSKKIASGAADAANSTWSWLKHTAVASWESIKHACASLWSWGGDRVDAISNSDPLMKTKLKKSLTELETQVNSYNNQVATTEESLNRLYETKNKTSVTLKAVDIYASRLGTLPIGFDATIATTKRDFEKYDKDLTDIKEKVAKSKWNAGADVDKVGDEAAKAAGTGETAESIDKAGNLMVKIASALGKDDAAEMIDSFKGAAKVAMSVGSLIAATGADMGITATLVVAGPIVMKIVDAASNALSTRTNNEKLAAQAAAKSEEVKKSAAKLAEMNKRIMALDDQIAQREQKVSATMEKLLSANVENYEKASDEQKREINLLVNDSNELAKLLLTTVK